MRALLALLFLGCATPVGTPCPPPDGATGTVVRQDVGCRGGLCLSIADARSICTAPCAGDGDCASTTGSPDAGLCGSGFVCAIPMVVGDFACRRLCTCRDDLIRGFDADDQGRPTTPTACR